MRTGPRPAHSTTPIVLLTLLLITPGSRALPLVIRTNLLAVATGCQYDQHEGLHAGGLSSVRVLETGIGLSADNGLGGFLSGTLIDYYGGLYQWAAQGVPGTTMVGAGGFWRFPPRPSLVSVTPFVAASVTTFEPLMHRVSLGVTLTAVAVTPEVEIYWMREYQPQHGRSWSPDFPKRIDYVGVNLRLGLGGWHQVNIAQREEETGSWYQ